MASSQASDLRVVPVDRSISTTDELLTSAEAARYLKIDVRTLRCYRVSGKIPAYQLGRLVRYRRKDVYASLVPVNGQSATSDSLNAFITSMTTADQVNA